MSTGKRIAKRSILGTRVVAPGIDGRFYPAVIQSVKTGADPAAAFNNNNHNRYLVRFDNSRKVSEFDETELIGPGFSSVGRVSVLLSGQRIYVTHLGREMEGTVLQHDTKADIVTVNLSAGQQLTVRREEIRLLESRKSSRLMVRQGSVQDFSKMADFNFVQERRRQRLNSEFSSNSDCSDIFSSRKRRGSETVSEEGSSGGEESHHRSKKSLSSSSSSVKSGKSGSAKDKSRGGLADKSRYSGGGKVSRNAEDTRLRKGCSSPIMSECTAAMVLMDLYGSPVSRSTHMSGHSEVSSGQMSPSSSGVSSLGSSWSSPSPTLTPPFPLPPDSPVSALLELSTADYHTERSDSDEGIVSDQSYEYEDAKQLRKKTERTRTIFQCTWPRCQVTETDCSRIELHVREQHLGRHWAPTNHELEEHEEEFYYTEYEVPLTDHEEYEEEELEERAKANKANNSNKTRGGKSEDVVVSKATAMKVGADKPVAANQQDPLADSGMMMTVAVTTDESAVMALPDHSLAAAGPSHRQVYVELDESRTVVTDDHHKKPAVSGAAEQRPIPQVQLTSATSSTAAASGVKSACLSVVPVAPVSLFSSPPSSVVSLTSTAASSPVYRQVTVLPHPLHTTTLPDSQQASANLQHQQHQVPIGSIVGRKIAAAGTRQVLLAAPSGQMIPMSRSNTAVAPVQLLTGGGAGANGKVEKSGLGILSSQYVMPLLADHCDMARPPHENPEYGVNTVGLNQQPASRGQQLVPSSPTAAYVLSSSLPIHLPLTTIPITHSSSVSSPTHQQGTLINTAAATSPTSPAGGKYIRLSPKPSMAPSPKSPVRRPRGDAKKCRKVYGMEQRDQWCTQCKWKKACTRFNDSQQTPMQQPAPPAPPPQQLPNNQVN